MGTNGGQFSCPGSKKSPKWPGLDLSFSIASACQISKQAELYDLRALIWTTSLGQSMALPMGIKPLSLTWGNNLFYHRWFQFLLLCNCRISLSARIYHHMHLKDCDCLSWKGFRLLPSSFYISFSTSLLLNTFFFFFLWIPNAIAHQCWEEQTRRQKYMSPYIKKVLKATKKSKLRSGFKEM